VPALVDLQKIHRRFEKAAKSSHFFDNCASKEIAFFFFSPFMEADMKFETNMGATDRIVRVVLAVVFAGAYFLNIVSGALGIILLVLGVIFLATSLISFCPLYLPFKISTKGK